MIDEKKPIQRYETMQTVAMLNASRTTRVLEASVSMRSASDADTIAYRVATMTAANNTTAWKGKSFGSNARNRTSSENSQDMNEWILGRCLT